MENPESYFKDPYLVIRVVEFKWQIEQDLIENKPLSGICYRIIEVLKQKFPDKYKYLDPLQQLLQEVQPKTVEEFKNAPLYFYFPISCVKAIEVEEIKPFLFKAAENKINKSSLEREVDNYLKNTIARNAGIQTVINYLISDQRDHQYFILF